MSDPEDHNPEQSTLDRRAVLGFAAIATGGAAFLASRIGQRASSDADSTDDATESALSHNVIADHEEIVSDDGFDIHIGPVHVFAPAGVAPEGTPLQVAITEHLMPSDDDEYITALGNGIEITLGDDLQPEQPITIEMDLSEWSDLTTDISDEAPLLMVSHSNSFDHPLYDPVTWNPQTQAATTVIEHLTIVNFIRFDLKAWINARLRDLLGLSFPTPSCAYEPHTSGAYTYSIQQSENTAVWPCVKAAGDQVVIELHSNSILPWAVQSTPATQGSASSEFLSIGPHLSRMYRGYHGVLGQDISLMMPGNTLTFRFSQSEPPMRFNLRMSTGLYGVSVLLWMVRSALEFFFRGKTAIVDELLDGFETAPCLIDLIRTTNDITDNFRFNTFISTALTCIELLIAEGAQKLGRITFKAVMTIVGLLVGGASLIAGGIYGAIANIIGAQSFSLTVTTESSLPTTEPTQEASGTELRIGSVQNAAGSWPMHGGNPARTRVMPGSGPRFDRPLVAKWAWSGQYWSVPVIENGIMYHSPGMLVGLIAVEFETGIERWRTLEGHEVGYQVALGDTIFVAVDTHFLYALDAATGYERWRTRVDGLLADSMIPLDSSLYCRTIYGGILAVNASDGLERWYVEKRANDHSSITIHDGMLYFGSGAGIFFALDTETGAERWQAPIAVESEPQRGLDASIVSGGTLFVRSNSGPVYALNPETGEEIWRTPIGESYVIRSAQNGRVYGANDIVGACALDAQSGELLWSFNTGMDMEVSGTFDDTVIVHSTGSWREMWRIHGLDAATGDERWSLEFGPRSYDPTVIGNHLMLHGLSGYVLGNATMATLSQDVVLRGAPAQTGIERGTASAGDEIDDVGARDSSGGQVWVEITIGGVTGWVPLDAIDPTTLSPEGGSDYEWEFYPE